MIVFCMTFLVCQALAGPTHQKRKELVDVQGLAKGLEKYKATLLDITTKSWEESDLNKDGILSIYEWSQIPTKYDTNNDGKITVQDFVRVVPDLTLYDTVFGGLFNDFDVDHDKLITRSDLEQLYKK